MSSNLNSKQLRFHCANPNLHSSGVVQGACEIILIFLGKVHNHDLNHFVCGKILLGSIPLPDPCDRSYGEKLQSFPHGLETCIRAK